MIFTTQQRTKRFIRNALFSIGAKVNLENLKAKMTQSKYIDENFELNLQSLKELLINRFEHLDFEQVKDDVLPFIKDKSKLDLWSKDFFAEITNRLLKVR